MPVIEDEENGVEVINVSSEIMRFEIDRLKYKLAPKERVRIHKNYATPRIMREGQDPVPSSIELMTNRKVLPITDKRARALLGKIE